MTEEQGGYGQYCPISRAVEVLGERWTMLIVRDLLLGNTRFNELSRASPGLSRTLLAKRLRQLERAGVVEHIDDRYELTPAGRELEPVVFGLGRWGAKWTFGEPLASELDPQILMWWIHQRLDFSSLPERRWVLAFRFRDVRERFWIVKDGAGASVCLAEPAFEIDATVDTDLATMYRVWLGRLPMAEALRAGTLRFDGHPKLVRSLPIVLELSPLQAPPV
jgi:DNA-binding HxlR family transcriptional regulator